VRGTGKQTVGKRADQGLMANDERGQGDVRPAENGQYLFRRTAFVERQAKLDVALVIVKMGDRLPRAGGGADQEA